MTARRRSVRWAPTAAVAAGVVLVLAASPARADKCTGAKLKAIGKNESGLLICHSKVAAKGGPSPLAACIQKVEGKYATAFSKAETCSGDQTVRECLAENCATAIRGDLPDPGPSRCEAARLKAASKTAGDKLTCNAKAAAKGAMVDPACIQKAEAKYQAAFAKATGCGGRSDQRNYLRPCQWGSIGQQVAHWATEVCDG